jgi:hypothetical protein
VDLPGVGLAFGSDGKFYDCFGMRKRLVDFILLVQRPKTFFMSIDRRNSLHMTFFSHFYRCRFR